jgi:uncharacterized protein (TIGR02268 family)
MRSFLPSWSPLLLVLLASVARAHGREQVAVRTLLLSEHPGDSTHRIYVKGQVVTVLRFEQPCDPARTKILGWEGRFEPLGVVGKKVLLEPLRDLDSDEGVPLLVTLKDGTEIPFLLRPPSHETAAWTDQQVNVFKNHESYEAMYSALMDALKEKQVLKEEVERYRHEETSEDHALAALLASGAVAQTPFIVEDRFSGKDADAKVSTTVFRGKGKVAVVFKLKNRASAQSWSMKMARLVSVSSGRDRAFALRSTVSSISPGASGVIAIVADKSAFVEEGAVTSLFLEIYRQDGLRQALVQLDPRLIEE